MLSIVDDDPFAPCPAPFNLAAHVLAAGERCPGKNALLILSEDDTDAWTYSDLRAAILGTATGLIEAGLTPGAGVLMRLGNTVDFPIAYLGAMAAGLVPMPTSSALTEAETDFIIRTARPEVILRAPEVACPSFSRQILLNELQKFRTRPPAQFHFGDPNRRGYIIFTSGTSGTPRAVAHAHRAIWARQMMFDGWYGLRPDDRLLHAGAFNWTYTLGTGLMDPWTIGATALIPAPGTPPQKLPEILQNHGATIFAAAPGVYRQILERVDRFELPELRHGLSAGEKLSTSVCERWTEVTRRPVFEAYGMSECSTFISQAPSEQIKSGTLGRPQKGRRIAILRDGVPVPRGEEGTIAVGRDDPGLMLGYLNAPQATRDKMCDGWFLTGDQAIMDEEGYISYRGREDDMMNAGGYRVSPIEVETVLAHFPGISSVAATTVRIKKDTDVIAAFYTGPAVLDEHHLRTYVSDKLARYKQPRLYLHLPELPLGANGKILRRRLRAQFERPND